MKFLNVETHHVCLALEELEVLTTEISGDVLVDAPDVQEDLNQELDKIQLVRDSIADKGMTRDAARQLDAAVEGFLIRNHISQFTVTPSIEGMSLALETADQERMSIFQRLIAWFHDKMQKAREWLARLFSDDGKAVKAAQSAKAMAERASTERKADEVAKMVKDPAAAAQSVRIDPSDEKSGTYEDFVDALQKNMEPVQADMQKLYTRLNANPVMRVVATNQESVKSFFQHMENTAALGERVRGVVDSVAGKLRSIENAQETVRELGLARNLLYRALGGESAEILDQIRQNQFNESAEEVTFDSVPYDELVATMVEVTRNTNAANSGIRIRDLERLEKAIQQLNAVADTNVFKRLSDSDRNVILQAMQGLINDISRYQSADMENWNTALKLYTGTAAFWTAELQVYYRTIAAIQRSAQQVFSEADRASLYEDFKKKGFQLDISPEELQRRGVGMESFDEAPIITAALESLDLGDMPQFPVFEQPAFVGRIGRMVALEEEATEQPAPSTEQKASKIRQWYDAFVAWLRKIWNSLVNRNKDKREKAKQIAAAQKEAVKTAQEAKGGEEPIKAIRPEVLKVFSDHMSDAVWYKESGIADERKQSITSINSFRYILSEKCMSEYVPAATGLREAVLAFLKEIDAVKSLQDVAALADSENWNKYGVFLNKLTASYKHGSNGDFNTTGELAKAFADSLKYADAIKQLDTDMTNDLAAIDKSIAGLQSKIKEFDFQNQEGSDKASVLFKNIQKLAQTHAGNLSAIGEIFNSMLIGSVLARTDTVKRMFESARKKDPNTVMYDAHEQVLLVSDQAWGFQLPSMEGFASVVAAMESMAVRLAVDSAVDSVLGTIPAYYGTPALEEEAPEEAKLSILQRLKNWFAKAFSWFMSLFEKKKAAQANSFERAKEAAKQREEAVKATKPDTEVRPEVKKVFDSYMDDSQWYAASGVRGDQRKVIENMSLRFAYSKGGIAELMLAHGEAIKDAKSLIHAINNASSLQELAQDIRDVGEGLAQVDALKKREPAESSNLREHAALFSEIAKNYKQFGVAQTAAVKLTEEINAASAKADKLLQSAGVEDASMASAAQANLNKLIAAGTTMLMLSSTFTNLTVEAILATGVQHNKAIKEMFAHYNEANKETPIQIGQTDIVLLAEDPVWRAISEI